MSAPGDSGFLRTDLHFPCRRGISSRWRHCEKVPYFRSLTEGSVPVRAHGQQTLGAVEALGNRPRPAGMTGRTCDSLVDQAIIAIWKRLPYQNGRPPSARTCERSGPDTPL